MRYRVRGEGEITLHPDDFIFEGGEGRVYGRGRTAYKIYHDPAAAISETKIRELSVIGHSRVVAPRRLILDRRGAPVGFTMDWIRDAVPLARLFPSAYQTAHGITPETILALVRAMAEAVSAVHEANCVMVDGNEFNYLVDPATYRTPYLIDVNAYQTPTYPGSAILPAIRDPLARSFSPESDWYAFAVVICQLFVGIHPFKGRHPAYTKALVGPEVLGRRMADGVSIFNPEVMVPPATRDFGGIPSGYRDWFVDLFERGKRYPPPVAPGKPSGRAVRAAPASTGRFAVKLLRRFDAPVIDHFAVFGVEITRTRTGVWVGGRFFPAPPETQAVLTPFRARPVFVRVPPGRGRIELTRPDGGPVWAPEMAAEWVRVIGNTVLVKSGGRLVELAVSDDGDAVRVAVRAQWPVMAASATPFDGVILESLLGRPHLVIPRPSVHGASACARLHLPELSGFQVTDARRMSRVCVVIGHRRGTVRRFVIRFDAGFAAYDIRATDVGAAASASLAVLDSGVAVVGTEDGSVEIFSHEIGDPRLETVSDPDVAAGLRLCTDGAALRGFVGRRLYTVRRTP